MSAHLESAQRQQRLRDIAGLLAKEIRDRGDAILIVRQVATACAAAVNSSAVMLLAQAAGVLAAELGLRRGQVAVDSGDAYDAARHQLTSRVSATKETA